MVTEKPYYKAVHFQEETNSKLPGLELLPDLTRNLACCQEFLNLSGLITSLGAVEHQTYCFSFVTATLSCFIW